MIAVAKTTVHTIGYQGVTIDRFIAKLRAEGVNTIIDVRANPVSRKPGFSKGTLAGRLASEGIAYFHFPTLGIPSRYRKEISDFDELFFLYEEEILPNRSEEVARVAALCRESTAALLCFEATPAECHRSRLAKHLSRLYETKVHHIVFGQKGSQSASSRLRISSRARVNPTGETGLPLNR